MRATQYFVLLCFALALLQASGAHLTGKVYDESSRDGIPDLTVKLIPPNDAKAPELTTFTDRAGKFSFTGALAGKYLLEVYYGVTVVHREVIVLDGELTKNISLQRKTTPAPIPSINPSNSAREITVAADKPWTDTQISVEKGDTISFKATGEIHWGSAADENAGPEGDRSKLRARIGSKLSYPIRGMGAGGLIARVGNGKPFKIGATSTTPMPSSGELYLGINDTIFSNNSGAFHVTVTRPSP